MKVLIAYASAGSGHRKAAEALYNYFRKNCPSFNLEIIDVLEKANPLFKNLYSYGYLFLVNHALWLWWLGFWLTYIKRLRPVTKAFSQIINALNEKKLLRFLIQENPDFVISTHFLPSEAVARLKKSKNLDSKLITVITDFGIHPFWVLDSTDIYIVASDFSKEQLLLEGVQEDRIKVLGIPIDEKFLKPYDKETICDKFGIDPNKFTVLIATGSFGIGPIEEIVGLLYKDVQILAVCANNKRLYTKLRNKNYPGVSVFGFIDNIQELMAISDIIITKPGGLTLSESLAMNLFPIFIMAIYGQETENIRILSKYNVGIYAKCTSLVKEKILYFKTHMDKIKSVKENVYKIKKPFAVREICNVVCEGSCGAACRRSV